MFRFQRRSFGWGAAALVLSSMLAACGGGGGSSPSAPGSPAKSGPSSFIHATTVVRRSNIPAVLGKLLRSGAYYSPRKGRTIRHIEGLKPMTSSAGEDLSYNGGPVMTGGNEYNILVNCNDESCWGGLINSFENSLYGSTMMNTDILPQYNAAGTYSAAGDYPVSYQVNGTLADSDIFNILYSVITSNNLSTGYGNEFHVFLGQGVDECSNAAGGCYSPDNTSQWAFCAYHGSNDWSDIGHVLYSVEPYQGVNGCEVSNTNSPNGVVADSTASTLSHETFETITDADVAANNLAWYNQQGGEIGDLCAPAAGVATGNVNLSGATWEIQMEYNNSVHDCSY